MNYWAIFSVNDLDSPSKNMFTFIKYFISKSKVIKWYTIQVIVYKFQS